MGDFRDDLGAFYHYGVSEELIGLLRCIRESTFRQGQADHFENAEEQLSGSSTSYAKLNEEFANKFILSILSRNIRDPIWMLCHMVAAIETTTDGCNDGACADFFWRDGNVTPMRFRSAFSEPRIGRGVTTELGKTLNIKYSDKAFNFHPKFVPLLVAYLDFVYLITGDYGRFSDLGNYPTYQSVSKFANELHADVQKYLDQHMATTQIHRKAKYQMNWLKSLNKKSPADKDVSILALISDSVILKFWLEHKDLKSIDESRFDQSPDTDERKESNHSSDSNIEKTSKQSLSFKRYKAVASDFLLLHRTLKEGRDKISIRDNASTIGDLDEGNVDLGRHDFSNFDEFGDNNDMTEQLEEVLTNLGCRISVMEQLEQPPLNAINFFSADSKHYLTELESAEQQFEQFWLTVIRKECFGWQQERILQCLRRSMHDKLPAMINCDGVPSYDDHHKKLNKLQKDVINRRFILVHILKELHYPDVAAEIIALLSDEARSKFSKLYGSSGEETFQVNGFFTKLSQLTLQIPELNQLLREMKKSFSACGREGLSVVPEPDDAETYFSGLEVIKRVQKLLGQHIAYLEKQQISLNGKETNFDSDLTIFKTAFKRTYQDNV